MKLINPTDEQLNTAFAEKVAGWRYRDGAMEYDGAILPFRIWTTPEGKEIGNDVAPRFTESATEILRYARNLKWSAVTMDGGFTVTIRGPGPGAICTDPDLETAFIVALLRYHGVEVEFAP